MPIYVNPDTGNHEIWADGDQPAGYITPEEWAAAHPVPEPEPAPFNPGPEYVERADGWWKIRFSKKDFLLLCGVPRVVALNTAIAGGNMLAKTVHDLLFAAEYVDVTDPDTVQMIRLLTTPDAGSVLTAEQAAAILTGVKYEETA